MGETLTAAAQQVVGPERRERVTHPHWSGAGCVKSRRPVNSDVMWLNLISAHSLRVILVLGLVLPGCLQVNRFNHQPAMARTKAEQFADAAFIEHDLTSAYGLLSQAMRNQLSLVSLTLDGSRILWSV